MLNQMTFDEINTSNWADWQIALAAETIHKGYSFFHLPSYMVKEVLGRPLESREIWSYDCYLLEHWGHPMDSICCGSKEVYRRGAIEVKEWVLRVTPEDQLTAIDRRRYRIWLQSSMKYSDMPEPTFWRNGIEVGCPYSEYEIEGLINLYRSKSE